MKNICILASGGGSNAEEIIAYFKNHEHIKIALIISNRKSAYVLERAANHDIPSAYIPKSKFENENYVLDLLKDHDIDYLILAGFLLLIPQYLIRQFQNKIINIHPALLPNYGGKGMFGHHVHQAVFDNNERKSGMTIHLVNEAYDEGEVLFQESVQLNASDTPDIIAKKVLALEHKNYPAQIEKWILSDQQ